METSMASKTLCKVIRIAGQSLLAIFAALFVLTAAAVLIVGIIEQDIISIFASAVMAFIAWVCWSVRGDVI